MFVQTTSLTQLTISKTQRKFIKMITYFQTFQLVLQLLLFSDDFFTMNKKIFFYAIYTINFGVNNIHVYSSGYQKNNRPSVFSDVKRGYLIMKYLYPV